MASDITRQKLLAELVTAALNSFIKEEVLIQQNGHYIETIGYPRRVGQFPLIDSSLLEWRMQSEAPPNYRSTETITLWLDLDPKNPKPFFIWGTEYSNVRDVITVLRTYWNTIECRKRF